VERWVSLKVNGRCRKMPVVNACSCLVPVAAGTASLLGNPTSFTLLKQLLLRTISVEVANGIISTSLRLEKSLIARVLTADCVLALT
jgi:hypothetical protein